MAKSGELIKTPSSIQKYLFDVLIPKELYDAE